MSQAPDKPGEPATALDSAALGAAKGKRNVWASTVSHVVMIETFLNDSILASWVASLPVFWLYPDIGGPNGCCGLPIYTAIIVPIGFVVMMMWHLIVRAFRRGQWKWRGGWTLRLAGVLHGICCVSGVVFLSAIPRFSDVDMSAARVVGGVLVLLVPLLAPFRLRVRVS